MAINSNQGQHSPHDRRGVRGIRTNADALAFRILREKHAGFVLDPKTEIYVLRDGKVLRTPASEVAQTYVADAIEENKRDPAGSELRNARIKLFVEWGKQVGGKKE